MTGSRWVVVGGAGFVGSAVCRRLVLRGDAVTAVDRAAPAPDLLAMGVSWQPTDLLLDDIELPEGRVVLVAGASDPRPRRPWTLAVDNAVATARVVPSLRGRAVVLVSSAEVYGFAPAPLREDTEPRLPVVWSRLERWADLGLRAAGEPCPPSRGYPLGQSLADLDPSGRWVYAMTKAVQEILVRAAVPAEALVVLRPANLFGWGQERLISTLTRRALAGRELVITSDTVRTFAPVDELVDAIVTSLEPGTYNVGSTVLPLDVLARRVMALVGREVPIVPAPAPRVDSCGVVDGSKLAAVVPPRDFDEALADVVRRVRDDDPPVFSPPLGVVVPPRPERPDVVALRHQAALWSGAVKHGNRWTGELTERLAETLRVGPAHRLLLTSSGTAALRLAVWAVAGAAGPGDAAVVPSYTFPATAEVVLQLGYRPVFCDVDPRTWTMDPVALDALLARTPGVRLVVPVDTLGAPAAYADIRAVCAAHGVAVVADSAPALGALTGGEPVGTQVAAHAFSMSFAKVISAGGAGGAVTVPAGADLERAENWLRSSLMPEASAIVALDQLAVLEELVERRHAVAAVYDRAIAAWGAERQRPGPGDRHSWVHYAVSLPAPISPAEAGRRLERLGVGTKPYYAPLLHEIPELRRRALGSLALPVTERLGRSALALPMSSELTPADAAKVVAAVDRAIGCPLSEARPIRSALLTAG